jgi:hypothetical protein
MAFNLSGMNGAILVGVEERGISSKSTVLGCKSSHIQKICERRNKSDTTQRLRESRQNRVQIIRPIHEHQRCAARGWKEKWIYWIRIDDAALHRGKTWRKILGSFSRDSCRSEACKMVSSDKIALTTWEGIMEGLPIICSSSADKRPALSHPFS